MEIFATTLNQMLILFLYILVGVLFRKFKIIPEESYKTIAGLENALLMPCLIFSTFYKNCTPKNLKEKSSSLYVALIILVLSILIAYALSVLLTDNPYKRRLYRYSLITSNYSFMGNAIALGIFGSDFLFEYMIFTLPLSVFTYTIGVSLIKNDSGRGNFNIKALFTPVFFAIAAGIILGLTGMPLPSFLLTSVDALAGCMSPLAMFLTGFIIGGYRLTELLKDSAILLLSLIRLLVLPLSALIFLKLFGVEESITACAICYLAMPLGLNTIIIPAAYGRDTRTGASMALISSLLAVITIPLVFTLLQI